MGGLELVLAECVEEGYIGYIGPVAALRLLGRTEVVVSGKTKITILIVAMLVALAVIVWAIVASVSELSTVWYW